MEEKYRQQFKKGALEMVLLSVVARGKTYGYEIILTLNRRGGPLFQNIREGTLYPVLYRLEDAGLLTSEVLAPPGGRAKKYYRITDAGRSSSGRNTNAVSTILWRFEPWHPKPRNSMSGRSCAASG